MEQENAPQTDTVTAGGVWPPPPTGSPPVPSVLTPTFAPVGRLARTILVLLGLYAASAVVGLAYAHVPAAGRQIEVGIMALAQSVLLLGMGVYFLIWTFRLNKNLRALGVTGMRNAPAWAVAYFFIPIISLYRPYQVFREIWQASDPGPAARAGQSWRSGKSPALLGFWWASVVLMNAMASLSARSAGDASIDLANNAAALLCTLLAFQVVRLVTARQEASARALLGI